MGGGSSGANVYEQLQAMLDRERLDILSIATYAPAHEEEAALAAVTAGVKVLYCEKPIAQTVAAGRRIARNQDSNHRFRAPVLAPRAARAITTARSPTASAPPTSTWCST